VILLGHPACEQELCRPLSAAVKRRRPSFQHGNLNFCLATISGLLLVISALAMSSASA
jgi:hypothetical protein